jgi:hypothetical protein
MIFGYDQTIINFLNNSIIEQDFATVHIFFFVVSLLLRHLCSIHSVIPFCSINIYFVYITKYGCYVDLKILAVRHTRIFNLSTHK